MSVIKSCIKKIFFTVPLPEKFKNRMYFFYKSRKEQGENDNSEFQVRENRTVSYAKYVLSTPNMRSKDYVEYKQHDNDNAIQIKYLAYYLTQFHPNEKNDEWWGKGTTEWTNVSKAVPQYEGHYQPRLPGELGYYDLRLKEVMERQIELAQNYGVYGFCFYYYWFNGERLLEKPLDLFLKNKELNMNFCISWANENWTKRFSGTNTDVLMQIGENTESDIVFINDVIPLLTDQRYVRIDGKPVLIVYRPVNLHEPKKVLKAWRSIVKEKCGMDIYIIATQEKADSCDWIDIGFDAETEFMPKAVLPRLNEINKSLPIVRKDFKGCIYDYKKIVTEKLYCNKRNTNRKVYPAVMPMWDNTARRNQNAVIFHRSTPQLYGQWLKDVVNTVINNDFLDEKLVFINAWNEWGEGAYLEPDRYWGYAYLEETKKSIM